VKNPVRASPEAYAEARAHFADHCAQCHANNGSCDTPMGPNLYPSRLICDLQKLRTRAAANSTTLQYGIRLSGMPAFGEPVDNDQDTWKLVTFIRHLPKLSEQEETEMRHLNPKPPDEVQEEKEEENFLKGDANSAAPATTRTDKVIIMKDIKAGDQIVTHATKKGDQLTAAEVKVEAMKMTACRVIWGGMKMDHDNGATPPK
jgi:hypothetical protein